MDRLFLDANTLFSAACRPDAGVRHLWKLPSAVLLTSDYAIEEARRNLREPEQVERLDALLEPVRSASAVILNPEMRPDIKLPEKDWPILGGAATSGATHLITGDVRHFGPYFGTEVGGVLILPPADYLKLPSGARRPGRLDTPIFSSGIGTGGSRSDPGAPGRRGGAPE